MQLYVVVIKILGLKDSDSNIIIILLHENKPVVWSGPYIMCCNYLKKTVQRENTSIIIKVNASSFEWWMVCVSKMSLDKDTR